MILRRSLLAAFGATLATAAFANETELYDAPPPPNSAFIRVIDAAGVGGMSVTVAEKAIALDDKAVSGYAIIPAGTIAVSGGSTTGTVEAVSGKFYTLVVSAGSAPILIEDAPIANPAKAGIYFYNFATSGAATLFAPKQNVAVIADIESGKSGFRDINAVTLDLEVRGPAGNSLIAGVALERRVGLTIVAFEGGKVVQIQNTVLP